MTAMNPPRRPDDGAHGAPYPTRTIVIAAHPHQHAIIAAAHRIRHGPS
jgi:hypothetical protein